MMKVEGRGTFRRWILSVAALVLLLNSGAPLLQTDVALAEDGEPSKAWKNITMIYGTDIKGKIDPCG